jgi:ADP-dependent phosphofructokinase/glucokinase
MVDRTAEIATLRQKLAAAAQSWSPARIREIESNAFKQFTSWNSDKSKSTPTLDDIREHMAALLRDMNNPGLKPHLRSPRTVNRLLTRAVTRSASLEEMGMDMDEIRMILAVRALRKLLNKGDRGDGDELVAAYRALGEAIVENKPMTRKNRARVAEYLREAG